ncbi:lasso peptide biosynthesis B2 protein [Nonomuraea lactucae]|uniref:lasso peptide biosynthesis B2 protein n=1 Tax=Nonomuraea lactucae TaxID=2249762 RepID=UPI0013B36635|nr:lasso peptide biosynthesis B2 protein [Nonomuraea lactucae]
MATVRVIPTLAVETSARLPQRVLASVCLPVAVAMLRLLPLRTVLATAGAAAVLMRRHPTASAAAQLVAARDWAATWWPGRAACLETSLAAYLSAALAGYHAQWLLGCRLAPAACHAWTQTCMSALGEPTSPDSPLHATVTVGRQLTCEKPGER